MEPELSQTNQADVYQFCRDHHDTYPDIDPLKANLLGKTAVVTGASKGVGRSTAISLIKAGCAKLAICARSDLSSLVHKLYDIAVEAGRERPTILSAQIDVTSEHSVREFSEAVKRRFGTVDMLVNNAGYMDNWTKVADTISSEWWRSWEVNVKGLYLCSKYFIPLVIASELRTILNISSIGVHMIEAGGSAYLANKLAICRLTELMALDYAKEGLIVIALHPGGVATELALTMPPYMHVFLIDTESLAGDFMAWIARERRDWLNGRYVSANWDVRQLEAKKDEIMQKNKLKFRLVV